MADNYLTREEVLETLRARLEMLGVTDLKDQPLHYCLERAAQTIETATNHSGVVRQLKFVLANRAAGLYLHDMDAHGVLDAEAVLASPAVKTLQMGDTRVEYDTNQPTKDQQVAGVIAALRTAGEAEVKAWRRIKW